MPKTAKSMIIAVAAILVVVVVVQALAGCAPAREKPKDLRPEPATPTMKEPPGMGGKMAPGGSGGKAAPSKPAGAPSGGGGQ